MSTDTVRLNVTLPKDLAETFYKVAGTRKRSRFVAEALKERIEKQKREELDKVLEAGYRAMAEEGSALTKEFETADLEGWDEY
ncbi:MAG: hypothetical protein GY864_01290 [Desulfobacterales bacterium]|nr:hypothetical protein [Desulfobacterales bacterium]